MTDRSRFVRWSAIAVLIARAVGPSSAFAGNPQAALSPPAPIRKNARRAPCGSTSGDVRPLATTRLTASPSGIDELPALAQATTFAGIYAALGAGTFAGTKTLDVASTKVFDREFWRGGIIEKFLPITLGLVYIAAGIGHFAAADAFRSIYPPRGTWGLWYVPGSSEFHVAWTGAVEVLGGLGLWFGAFQTAIAYEIEEESLGSRSVQPLAASALFLLTVLVTPANIYMYTHGANMEPDMTPLNLQFHIVRFAIQVVLLSQLYVLAKDSLSYALWDKVDDDD